MKKLKLAWALAALIISGCAGLSANWAQARSVGHVPCPESEITVSETGNAGSTWIAECRGRRYFCSIEYGGAMSSGRVSCSAEGRD